MKRAFSIQLVALFVLAASAHAAEKEEGFKNLFDGKSFDGWKINENPKSWKIAEGAMVCKGPRSHIFYAGDDKPFKNFHLKVDVLTKPGSNGGIYFHTKFQKGGWPKAGFEAQVNNSHGDPKRTGSLYAVVNVTKAPAKDNEWFTEEVIVNGNKITIKVDGKTLVDYTEPEGKKPGRGFTRKIDEGTFAFQCHDPKSEVHFKNVRVKRLP